MSEDMCQDQRMPQPQCWVAQGFDSALHNAADDCSLAESGRETTPILSCTLLESLRLVMVTFPSVTAAKSCPPGDQVTEAAEMLHKCTN